VPREVFVAGQILTAAEMNVVSDATVMTFAGTAARGSAIPSPTEGMMSYLEDVNGLTVYNGSAWVPAASGATLAAGTILQVQSAILSAVASTTSTSYVDASSLSLTITPVRTNSKFLVVACAGVSNSGNDDTYARVVRNAGTDVAVGNGDNGSFVTGNSTSGLADAMFQGSVSFIDAPTTPLPATLSYRIQFKVDANTGYLNRTRNNANANVASTLTVYEIGV